MSKVNIGEKMNENADAISNVEEGATPNCLKSGFQRVFSCPATNNRIKSCRMGCDNGRISNSYSNGNGNFCDECSWMCFPCAIVLDIAMFPIRIFYDYSC